MYCIIPANEYIFALSINWLNPIIIIMDTKATYKQGKKIYGSPIRMVMAMLLFTSISVSVLANEPGKFEAREEVKQQIVNKIPCPEFVTDNSPANYIRAIVQVDEQGNLSLTDVNAGTPQLKEYVLNRLDKSRLYLDHMLSPDKFILIIKFQI